LEECQKLATVVEEDEQNSSTTNDRATTSLQYASQQYLRNKQIEGEMRKQTPMAMLENTTQINFEMESQSQIRQTHGEFIAADCSTAKRHNHTKYSKQRRNMQGQSFFRKGYPEQRENTNQWE
jgi:uncharacterized membrane protein YfhO